jgi:hypothetical protein
LEELQVVFESITSDSAITMSSFPKTATSSSLCLFTNYPNFGRKLQIRYEMPVHLNFLKNVPLRKIRLEISSCNESDFSGLATVKSTLEELVINFNPAIHTSCENSRLFEQADLSVISELENLETLTIADQSDTREPITGTRIFLPPVFPMKDNGQSC